MGCLDRLDTTTAWKQKQTESLVDEEANGENSRYSTVLFTRS